MVAAKRSFDAKTKTRRSIKIIPSGNSSSANRKDNSNVAHKEF